MTLEGTGGHGQAPGPWPQWPHSLRPFSLTLRLDVGIEAQNQALALDLLQFCNRYIYLHLWDRRLFCMLNFFRIRWSKVLCGECEMLLLLAVPAYDWSEAVEMNTSCKLESMNRLSKRWGLPQLKFCSLSKNSEQCFLMTQLEVFVPCDQRWEGCYFNTHNCGTSLVASCNIYLLGSHIGYTRSSSVEPNKI